MTESEARDIGRALVTAAVADAREGVTFTRRLEDAAAELLPAFAAEEGRLFAGPALERFAALVRGGEQGALESVRARAVRPQVCRRCGATWEG